MKSYRSFIILLVILVIFSIVFNIFGAFFFSEAKHKPNHVMYVMTLVIFVCGLWVFGSLAWISKSIYIKIGFFLFSISIALPYLRDILQIGSSVWFVVIKEVLLVTILIMFLKGLKTLDKSNSPW